MEKIIKVGNEERFYFNTYSSREKAIEVAKLYKKCYNCSFSVKLRTTPILVSDVYDLYMNKISPLSNGVMIL